MQNTNKVTLTEKEVGTLFNHLVLLVDSEYLDSRIAFVKSSPLAIKFSDIEDIYSSLSKNFAGEFVVHRIQTDSLNTLSISELDPFFDDVIMYTDPNEFLNILLDAKNETNMIAPVTLANYILSKRAMTHLTLQKILYLVYAECLIDGFKISQENPLAFDYGPVFKTVYDKYKYGKKEVISETLEPKTLLELNTTDSYNCITDSVDNVLESTLSKEGWALVNITHTKEGPWEYVYNRVGQNAILSDELIKERHHFVTEML